MTDVNVTIDGIIMYCDESVSGLSLGNGYTIRKIKSQDLPFSESIVDGNGRITLDYLGSRLCSDDDISFMCIHKTDVHQICLPSIEPGVSYSGDDLMCEDQLSAYKDNEMDYLYRMFSLLRIFKEGNIGYKDIFFVHKFTVLGFMNHTSKQTNTNVTRNVVDTTFYSLSPQELIDCNSFLSKYSGKEYTILKDCIDEFVWGLEQVDLATGFEQYTTALEMMLLAKNQQNKKQVLSKRIAVLLGATPSEIDTIYKKMLGFYRYRSESLHEGKGQRISSADLKELEEITRRVLKEYLETCSQRLKQKPTASWTEIKDRKISDIRNDVATAIRSGTLPPGNDTVRERICEWVKKHFKQILHWR